MDLNEIKQDTGKKIWQFAVPAIVSMVLTAFITVADGFFMGNFVGKEGIAAVNLGLPIVYLYLGIGLMISIGGVSIAGMALGSGDLACCGQVFSQTIATAAAASLALSGIMGVCFQPMLTLLQADGLIIRYFREYHQIMLLELPVMVVDSAFGMFIRGEGHPEFYLQVTVVNALLNVVLDYVLAGLFSLGAAGIAWASLASALVSLAWILSYFHKKARVYHLGRFRFSPQTFVQGILNGSSEFIGEMSTGIAMFAYNLVIMRRVGVDGVTAFTIVGYVAYLFSMVVIGFGQGASPLVSFCYGARERRLAADIRRKTTWYVSGAGILVFLVMTLLADGYGGMFVESEEVKAMVASGMWIFMVSFFFSGINAIASFYFTATGRAFQSAAISFSRGLGVLLVCIFLLPALFGMTGVWLAAPVTEVVTLGITVVFLQREERSLSLADLPPAEQDTHGQRCRREEDPSWRS